MGAITGGAPDAIVVGGGVAGLAAGTALAEAGARIVLLEARPYLGGRARSWIDPDTGSVVDNGQHLFIGCYRETRRLLDRLGTGGALELQSRLEVPFVERGGRLRVFRLPALLPHPLDLSLGLLGFPGLSARDRLSLFRVARAARRSGRGGGDAAFDDRTVASLLRDLDQSEEASRRIWRPLAIAALNESPERASAAMFLPVLRGALLSGPQDARLGLARVGLSDLYAEPAARYLRARGSELRLRAQVRRVLVERDRCAGVMLADGARLAAPSLVVAVPPADLLEMLMPDVAADPFFSRASRLETTPIVSVYLWFGAPVLQLKFAGLIGGTWQWVFNRGGHEGGRGGLHGVTMVRSAARDVVDRPKETLIRSSLEELHAFFPRSRRAPLRHAMVIKEKRATISPLPGSMRCRPSFRTPYRGLHLAGDWTATGLPATVEGAALSGHACAGQVTEGAG
ncbi:MAG: hydroxysqualene dehydroxylase HpnE [Acidobacteriota bacterium]